MTLEAITWLHRSLTARETPEAVAARILALAPPAMPPPTTRLATEIANASLKARFGWSSMPTTFRGADPMDAQVAKARTLAIAFLKADLPEADDLEEIHAFIDQFNALIGKSRGANSFRYDRLDRTARSAAGLTLSRRRYAKLFRMADRLEGRVERMQRAMQRHALLLVGKSGLVADIKRDDVADKPWTLSFIAYYAARMKLRSEFTITGQQRPFDALSKALLDGCAQHEDANWYTIAHVFPREDVLSRLSEAQKGALLGRWFRILVQTADVLKQAYEASSINLETMIVKRGDDSSTWNMFAGAWNRARDNWISLIVALGMDRTFDALLPGKVMRLMAADVAAWHRHTGGGLHPDTAVWRDLPKPWLVLAGQEICTISMIEAACARHGVAVEASGWTAPRPRTTIADFKPTPELVHGVTVENPYFANFLRRLGGYSGKPLNLGLIREILDPS